MTPSKRIWASSRPTSSRRWTMPALQPRSPARDPAPILRGRARSQLFAPEIARADAVGVGGLAAGALDLLATWEAQPTGGLGLSRGMIRWPCFVRLPAARAS